MWRRGGDPLVTIVGVDLGSRRLGFVVAGSSIPLRIHHADTAEVNPHALGGTADAIRRLVDGRTDGLPPDVVVEYGTLYIPHDATPQQAQAMAAAHEVMASLLLLIRQALPGPLYRVHTIARRTWSSRVVPHHRGNVSNQEARAGLAQWLDPEGNWPKLSDQHRVDATGAVLGWLLGPTAKARKAHVRRERQTQEQIEDTKLAKEQSAAVKGWEKWRAKVRATGCNCGPNGGPKPFGVRGPHRLDCRARQASPKVQAQAAAAARYVPITR